MDTMTVQFGNTQNFLQGFEKFISKYTDVSFQMNDKKSLPIFPKKINTSKVESIVEKEAKKYNLTVVNYLNYMIAYEKEKALVVEDIKIMEEEIKQVNNGTLKLKSAYSLLDEL